MFSTASRSAERRCGRPFYLPALLPCFLASRHARPAKKEDIAAASKSNPMTARKIILQYGIKDSYESANTNANRAPAAMNITAAAPRAVANVMLWRAVRFVLFIREIAIMALAALKSKETPPEA
jgi:hypothetical protein